MSNKPEFRTVLICPSRDLRIESRIDTPVAESLREFITQVDAGALIVSVSNPRVLECVINFPDLIEVELGLLTGVPGCDYTPQFDQLTWSLDRVGYDGLVVEAEANERMESLKKAERPRSQPSAGSADTVDINALKVPKAFGVFRNEQELGLNQDE